MFDFDKIKVFYVEQIIVCLVYGVVVCKFFELMKIGECVEVIMFFQGDLLCLQIEYFVMVDKMVNLLVQEMVEDFCQVVEDGYLVVIQMIVLVVVVVVLVLVIGVFIMCFIIVFVCYVVVLVEVVVQGDLFYCFNVVGKDEISCLLQVLQYMSDNLYDIVFNVCNGIFVIDMVVCELV